MAEGEMPPDERKAMELAAAVRSGRVIMDDWPAPNSWRDIVKAEQETASRQEQQKMSESTRDSLRPRQPDQRESAEAHREAAEFWRQTADAAQGEAATDRLRAREEEGQAARARVR